MKLAKLVRRGFLVPPVYEVFLGKMVKQEQLDHLDLQVQ